VISSSALLPNETNFKGFSCIIFRSEATAPLSRSSHSPVPAARSCFADQIIRRLSVLLSGPSGFRHADSRLVINSCPQCCWRASHHGSSKVSTFITYLHSLLLVGLIFTFFYLLASLFQHFVSFSIRHKYSIHQTSRLKILQTCVSFQSSHWHWHPPSWLAVQNPAHGVEALAQTHRTRTRCQAMEVPVPAKTRAPAMTAPVPTRARALTIALALGLPIKAQALTTLAPDLLTKVRARTA
jgi:hypothetical protein